MSHLSDAVKGQPTANAPETPAMPVQAPEESVTADWRTKVVGWVQHTQELDAGLRSVHRQVSDLTDGALTTTQMLQAHGQLLATISDQLRHLMVQGPSDAVPAATAARDYAVEPAGSRPGEVTPPDVGYHVAEPATARPLTQPLPQLRLQPAPSTSTGAPYLPSANVYAKPPKDPMLPTYDGTQDVQEYFSLLEDIFRAKCTSPTDQFNFSVLAMRGPARSLVKEKPLTSYEELKTCVKARFRLPNEDFHLAVRLRALQQHGDNYDAYLRDYR